MKISNHAAVSGQGKVTVKDGVYYTALLLVMGILLLSTPMAYADISGKVYQDFNANGQQDTGTSFNEPGAAGVTIKAYGTDGSEAADGTYTLSGLTAGEHYRIEFTWTDAWLKPGVAGGTSVQFAQDGASGVNASVNAP